MPHHDHNHSCSHECDYSHDEGGSVPSDNLFARVDLEHVGALNCASPMPGKVIKPWHERTDETVFIESDADDQLILRIPFTGGVKLRAILLKSGPEDQTPTKICLFPNEDTLDFDDVADSKPAQEFSVAQNREVVEYALKPAKFSNVTHIHLFFPSASGAETTRIYYLGFLGSWSERKSEAVVTVYESQANLADHEKIKGTEGNFNTPQT